MSKWESGALKGCSNNHDRRTQKDHLSPSKDISDENGKDGSNEAAKIVGRDCDTLNGRYMVVVWMRNGIDLRKYFDKTAKGQKTTHNSLIISKETDYR